VACVQFVFDKTSLASSFGIFVVLLLLLLLMLTLMVNE